MNMIAGLVPVDEGEILFDGKSLKDTAIGYVFQNYRDALFPWITSWDNIAYPLRRKGMKEAEVKARVDELVKLFEIRFDLQRYPYELSGGRCRRSASCGRSRRGPRCCFSTSRSRRSTSR